jgi:hypothetical protein
MVAITRSQLKNMSNNNTTTTTVTNPNKKRKGEPIVLIDSPPPSDMDADYSTSDEEYDEYDEYDEAKRATLSLRTEVYDEANDDEATTGIRSDITKHGYRKDSFIASDDEEDEDYVDVGEKGSEVCADSEDEEEAEEDDVLNVKEMILKAISKKFKPRGSANKETDIRQTFTEEEETYFESLSKEEQDNIADTYTSVISSENSPVPIKFQIINSNLDNYVKT